VTIDQVISEYILENGEPEAKRLRLTQIAMSGLREFHMDLTGTSKMVRLTKSSVNTLDLPQDYLQYIRIGICDRNGNLHNLGLNNNMCSAPFYDDCGNATTPQTLMTTSDRLTLINFTTDYAANHFRNGEMTGAFFGLGGGNNVNGYYKIDTQRWIIQLQGVDTQEIILEYLPNPEQMNEDGRMQYTIPQQCVDALKNWVYWKLIARNRSYSLGEKQMAERSWFVSFDDARSRLYPIRMQEIQQSWRTFNTLALKM
jgi:hypothetical protein|tara:strand:- start:2878 stop:3645 length:768 start_codon:yes stop_codon:yes gene_type:complete